MPAYSEPKSYDDGQVLTEAMLDEQKSYRETFFNTTKLDAANIANDAVTDALLRNSVGLSVIGRATNSTGDPADITAASDGQILMRSGSSLAFALLGSANFPNNVVTDAILRDSAATSVIGRASGSAGDPADIAASADGQVLRRASGALTWGTLVAANFTAGCVDTNALGTGAVTNAKLAQGNANNSSSSSGYATGTSATDIINVQLTCTGTRLVQLSLVPDGSANVAYIGLGAGGDSYTSIEAELQFYDVTAAAVVSRHRLQLNNVAATDGYQIPPSAMMMQLTPPASGARTWRLDVVLSSSGGTGGTGGLKQLLINYCKLQVVEL